MEGGDYGYRFRNGRKGLHPFTAWNGELPGTLPMVAGTGEAPCGVLAYEADNLPEDYRGNLLVTSWGDHRIERYRLRPRGASFQAAMEPVVVGGEDFRPVGIAIWRPTVRSTSATGSTSRTTCTARGESGGCGIADDRDDQRRSKSNSDQKSPRDRPSLTGEHVEQAICTNPRRRPRSGCAPLPADQVDLQAVAATDPSPLVRASALRRLADPAAKSQSCSRHSRPTIRSSSRRPERD